MVCFFGMLDAQAQAGANYSRWRKFYKYIFEDRTSLNPWLAWIFSLHMYMSRWNRGHYTTVELSRRSAWRIWRKWLLPGVSGHAKPRPDPAITDQRFSAAEHATNPFQSISHGWSKTVVRRLGCFRVSLLTLIHINPKETGNPQGDSRQPHTDTVAPSSKQAGLTVQPDISLETMLWYLLLRPHFYLVCKL